MAELSNFDKWAAGYFSWVEPLPTPDEMQIARDAYEAGRRNAAKVWTEADQAAWMALPEEERRRRNHEEAARGVTVASEHQAVRGVFAGESMAKAAEGWAAWCERRHLSSLSEFLIDVSRALGVAPTVLAGPRGVHELANVVSNLLQTGRYVDEEGEATAALLGLLKRLTDGALVPATPTQAMLDAADKVLDSDPRHIAAAWRAMVAASGVAPTDDTQRLWVNDAIRNAYDNGWNDREEGREYRADEIVAGGVVPTDGVTPTGEAQRLAWEACRLLCAAAVVQENPDKVVCPPAFVVAVRAAMLALRNAGVAGTLKENDRG